MSTSMDSEVLVQMLRRGLLLALQSMDAGVFQMKLDSILEAAGDLASVVLTSGLDLEERTALHIAVETRFEEAVKLLVATGLVEILLATDAKGWSPLHTAIDLSDVNITRALLLNLVPTTVPGPGTGPGTGLKPSQLFEVLKRGTGSAVGATALHMAVRRNSLLCAVTLLEAANRFKGSSATTQNGGSTNTTTTTNTSEEEEEEEGEGDEDEKSTEQAKVLQVLQLREFHGQAREGSIRLNKLKDKDGDTPLHWAVKTNNYAMVRLLCSYGAQPRYSHNSQGQTPIVLAKYVLRNAKMTKLLSNFLPKSSNEDVNSIQNTKDDDVLPLVLRSEPIKRGSTVDGEIFKPRGVRRTGVVAETAPPASSSTAKDPAGKTSSASGSTMSMTSCVADFTMSSFTARPYLHREVKGTPVEEPLNRTFQSDSLVVPSRCRAHSLKICRRELETLRSNTLRSLARSSGKTSVVILPRLVPLKSRRRASMWDPADYYPMASERRGICLVINNMTYWHSKFPDRGGGDKDELRVEKVFSKLGFLVKILRNLSSGEMRSQLRYLGRKTDHTSYDCFVAVIMAHGSLGQIYGVNGDPFDVHQLTTDFTAEKCPSLAGKPKLFFIQACRGDEYQLGYALPISNANSQCRNTCNTSTLGTPQGLNSQDNEVPEEHEEPAIAAAKIPRSYRLVPSFADFLLSYATLAGFKAQRDPQQGSVYIQTLCQLLEASGRVRSLLDIVTSVHKVVTEQVFREASCLDDDGGTVFQQTPEVQHTLTRRVQFV